MHLLQPIILSLQHFKRRLVAVSIRFQFINLPVQNLILSVKKSDLSPLCHRIPPLGSQQQRQNQDGNSCECQPEGQVKDCLILPRLISVPAG